MFSISALLFGNKQELEIPLEFELATEPTIEIGDIVLTVWGWYGKVHRIGTSTYGLTQLYQMQSGALIEPDRAIRHSAHECEIVSVLS